MSDELVAAPTPHERAKDAMEGAALLMETAGSTGTETRGETLAERISAAALRGGIRVGQRTLMKIGFVYSQVSAQGSAGETG